MYSQYCESLVKYNALFYEIINYQYHIHEFNEYSSTRIAVLV